MMATTTSPSKSTSLTNRKPRTSFGRKSLSKRQTTTPSTSQPAIVIELGSAFLRVGFSGEANPRCILSSPLSLTSPAMKSGYDQITIAQKTEDEWEQFLTPLLENICVDRLLIRPRNHRVLLLEPMISPTSFREAITKVLLKTMHFPSLLFISDPAICPLHAHGFRYGLVLDMGRYETTTVGSFNGRSLPHTFHAVPVGYETVLHYFRQEFNKNKDPAEENLIPSLKDAQAIIEQCTSKYLSSSKSIMEEVDINAITVCNVPSTQKLISVTMKDVVDAWKNTCFNIFDPNSITYAFLSTILDTPIDLRKVLLHNICITGGGPAMLESSSLFSKMLFDSFHVDILQLNENIQFKTLIPCLTSIPLKGSQSKFQRSLINWIGASILGATMELNDERWVHRNVYLGEEGDFEQEEEETLVVGVGEGDSVYDWLNVAS